MATWISSITWSLIIRQTSIEWMSMKWRLCCKLWRVECGRVWNIYLNIKHRLNIVIHRNAPAWLSLLAKGIWPLLIVYWRKVRSNSLQRISMALFLVLFRCEYSSSGWRGANGSLVGMSQRSLSRLWNPSNAWKWCQSRGHQRTYSDWYGLVLWWRATGSIADRTWIDHWSRG